MAENTNAARADNSSRRSRYSTNRNQNLATIASLKNAFKGKNEKVAVIGKSHENGVSYEIFLEEVQEYVSTEYNDGCDLELLLESQIDDFEQASDTQKPRLIRTGDADEEKAMFRENYSEHLNARNYTKRIKRVYLLLFMVNALLHYLQVCNLNRIIPRS